MACRVVVIGRKSTADGMGLSRIFCTTVLWRGSTSASTPHETRREKRLEDVHRLKHKRTVEDSSPDDGTCNTIVLDAGEA